MRTLLCFGLLVLCSRLGFGQSSNEAIREQNERITAINGRLQQAKELEAAGNYDQAIIVLQQASQMDSNQALPWAHLGDAQLHAKKYSEAIESYKRAIGIEPTSGKYHGGLAQAYSKSGQIENAVGEYMIAAQVETQRASQYYFDIGAVFTNAGKSYEAISAFELVIQLDPNLADAFYWKGVNLAGLATVYVGGKPIAPSGFKKALQQYLDLSPTGEYAAGAKQLMSGIEEGATPLPRTEMLKKAYAASTPFVVREEYSQATTSALAVIKQYDSSSALAAIQKAQTFWADRPVPLSMQRQAAAERSAAQQGVAQQAQGTGTSEGLSQVTSILGYDPSPSSCSSVNRSVKAESKMSSGPGSCSGEVDAWLTNISTQKVMCTVIFHRKGVWDKSSKLAVTLSPGEKLGGFLSPGGIWTCGADSPTALYICFPDEQDMSHSCNARVQWAGAPPPWQGIAQKQPQTGQPPPQQPCPYKGCTTH